MERNKFSIKNRFRSFVYAFNGIKTLIKEEHNSRIHLLAIVIVLVLGFVLHISKTEWIMVCLSIGFVLSVEIINSAIENLADFVSQEKHPLIKKVKDLASSAVLISAAVAFIIGLIIFLPKIVKVC